MQTDVYFRWYDLNYKEQQQNDRKERQPFVALQAAIRRNTENSVSNGAIAIEVAQSDHPNGDTVVEEKEDGASIAKLSVSEASNSNKSIGTAAINEVNSNSVKQ